MKTISIPAISRPSLEKETFKGSPKDHNAKDEELRNRIREGLAHRLQRQPESRALKGQHHTGSDQKLGMRFYREKARNDCLAVALSLVGC